MIENPTVVETAPKMERIEAIVARYSPSRGLIADSFPLRIAIATEQMAFFRQHQSIVQIAGEGGVGTKLTFHFANGEAIYELTEKIIGQPIHVAERRSYKLLLAGKEVEAPTITLRTLGKLGDNWYTFIAVHEELIKDESPALKDLVRLRNMQRNPQIVFRLSETKGIYNVITRVQRETGTVYLAEREKLQTKNGTWIRLPAVHVGGGALLLHHDYKIF